MATYTDPLTTRYATKPMLENFSEEHRMVLWRKLWIALAESEKELGLNITDEQIAQMKEHVSDINFDVARAREKSCATTLWLTSTPTVSNVPRLCP